MRVTLTAQVCTSSVWFLNTDGATGSKEDRRCPKGNTKHTYAYLRPRVFEHRELLALTVQPHPVRHRAALVIS
jgi:hypothetical protein